MKVLFKKHVVNVWKVWEIKEVKPGYAQNFLLPQGHAVEVTDAVLKKMKQAGQKDEAHRRDLISGRHEIVEKLNGKSLQFSLTSWENGKVYGGIGEKDIISEIKKLYKIELSKKHISLMDGHLKKLWEHDVYIKLWKDAMAKMKVELKPTS